MQLRDGSSHKSQRPVRQRGCGRWRYDHHMQVIPAGTTGEHRLLVTPEVSIDFLGTEEARVLGTPWMIAYMEMTARNTLKPLLDENEDSVGSTVNVTHLAPSPVGLSVRFVATVTAVNGRRVSFSVEAWDDVEKIGEGTHERFIINIPKFVAKLALKRAGV